MHLTDIIPHMRAICGIAAHEPGFSEGVACRTQFSMLDILHNMEVLEVLNVKQQILLFGGSYREQYVHMLYILTEEADIEVLVRGSLLSAAAYRYLRDVLLDKTYTSLVHTDETFVTDQYATWSNDIMTTTFQPGTFDDNGCRVNIRSNAVWDEWSLHVETAEALMDTIINAFDTDMEVLACRTILNIMHRHAVGSYHMFCITGSGDTHTIPPPFPEGIDTALVDERLYKHLTELRTGALLDLLPAYAPQLRYKLTSSAQSCHIFPEATPGYRAGAFVPTIGIQLYPDPVYMPAQYHQLMAYWAKPLDLRVHSVSQAPGAWGLGTPRDSMVYTIQPASSWDAQTALTTQVNNNMRASDTLATRHNPRTGKLMDRLMHGAQYERRVSENPALFELAFRDCFIPTLINEGYFRSINYCQVMNSKACFQAIEARIKKFGHNFVCGRNYTEAWTIKLPPTQDIYLYIVYGIPGIDVTLTPVVNAPPEEPGLYALAFTLRPGYLTKYSRKDIRPGSPYASRSVHLKHIESLDAFESFLQKDCTLFPSQQPLIYENNLPEKGQVYMHYMAAAFIAPALFA